MRTIDYVDPALKTRLERCSTLPTLPAIAVKVLELCQRDNLDLSEIAKVIANDPALSAKVLKTVNSAAFALRQEVRTLSHAVALLGVNTVRTLVLSFSLLRDVRRSQRAALNTYWKRSLLAGLSAREIASALRFPFREEAFLAALLQDIGMLALRQLGDGVYNDLFEAAAYDHDRIIAGEHAAFDSDHAQVGAWLIARWRLPERFRLSTAHSHKPWRLDGKTDPDLGLLVRITAVAGSVADIWVRPDAVGAAQRAHIEVAKILQVPDFSLEPIVRSMAASLGDISQLFEIDLGTPERINGVLAQAQEALAIASVAGAAALGPGPTAGASDRLADQRDAVTGLPGKAWAHAYLEEQMALAAASSQPISVVLADIDNFDAATAGLPKSTVDAILVSVAACLGGKLRKRDAIARTDEGEFVLILPETGSEGASAVAERARQQLAETKQPSLAPGKKGLTLSLGCATFAGATYGSGTELLTLADRALYAGKRTGGNRVIVHQNAGAVPQVARA